MGTCLQLCAAGVYMYVTHVCHGPQKSQFACNFIVSHNQCKVLKICCSNIDMYIGIHIKLKACSRIHSTFIQTTSPYQISVVLINWCVWKCWCIFKKICLFVCVHRKMKCWKALKVVHISFRVGCLLGAIIINILLLVKTMYSNVSGCQII